MTARSAAGYVLRLALLAGGVVAFFAAYGARRFGADLGAVVSGVVTAAIVDLATFGLHAYGMFRAPERFLIAWGASIAVKFAVFGGAIGLAAAASLCDARSLAVGCATGFMVFSHHEWFVLRGMTDRADEARRRKKTSSDA
jgi:hypothetical protein